MTRDEAIKLARAIEALITAQIADQKREFGIESYQKYLDLVQILHDLFRTPGTTILDESKPGGSDIGGA